VEGPCDPNLGSSHRVDVCSFGDVLEVHAAYIFRKGVG
jgi:hypothetical protein